MFSILHLGYCLAAFYGVLALFILRLTRKPSCRVCLFRGSCPNRLRGASQIAGVPRCVRQAKTGSSLA
jgi:hypothetical protein